MSNVRVKTFRTPRRNAVVGNQDALMQLEKWSWVIGSARRIKESQSWKERSDR
jgi:hypothetical protein